MHLATANAATIITSYEDPSMADFVAQLDAVNASADAAAGFVWRFVEDEGDSAEIARVFASERVLFNMSVWESVDTLEAWVYSGQHLDVVRRRAETRFVTCQCFVFLIKNLLSSFTNRPYSYFF